MRCREAETVSPVLRRLRCRASAVALQAALAGLVASPAFAQSGGAQGTGLTGFFSQRFGGTQELGDSSGDRYSGQSNTRFGISTSGGTDTTIYGAQLGFSAALRTDRDDVDVFDVLLPDVSGTLRHILPRGSLDASLSVLPRFLSERQFADEITIGEEGDTITGVDTRNRTFDPLEITIAGSLGASWRIDPLNSLSASANFRLREYDETSADIQPNRNYGTSLGFSHRLDSRSTIGLQGQLRRFESDREGQEDTTVTSLSASASRRLTPRHDGSATLGLSFSDTESGAPDLIGSLGATYRTERTVARVSVGQDVTQNADGEVNSTLQFRASVSERINAVSALTASSSLAFDSPLATDADDTLRFNITAQYEYRITERWTVVTGYGFRLEADAGDSLSDATGRNQLFLSFSRQFSF